MEEEDSKGDGQFEFVLEDEGNWEFFSCKIVECLSLALLLLFNNIAAGVEDVGLGADRNKSAVEVKVGTPK